jgi:hypothetical protein
MADTRYEIDDFAGVDLEMMNERGDFASLLGARAFSRLNTLAVILHQVLNEEAIAEKLETLYSKVRHLTNDDSLFTLAWICAENRYLKGVSPLEALFDKSLSGDLLK